MNFRLRECIVELYSTQVWDTMILSAKKTNSQEDQIKQGGKAYPWGLICAKWGGEDKAQKALIDGFFCECLVISAFRARNFNTKSKIRISIPNSRKVCHNQETYATIKKSMQQSRKVLLFLMLAYFS